MRKTALIVLGLLVLVVCWGCAGGVYHSSRGYYRTHHRGPWIGFRDYYRRPIVVVPPGETPDIDRPVAVPLPEPPPEMPEAAPMPEPMPDIGMPDMDMGDIGDFGGDF